MPPVAWRMYLARSEAWDGASVRNIATTGTPSRDPDGAVRPAGQSALRSSVHVIVDRYEALVDWAG
jgi:hypothetical protein